MSRRCDDCVWSAIQDEGYSNYTVEGSTFYCVLGLHPSGEDGVDQFYGQEPSLAYVENCDRFEEGDGLYLDVDCDEKYHESELRPEQVLWLGDDRHLAERMLR